MMLLIVIFFLLIECFGQNGVQFEDLIFSNLEKAIDDLQFKALKRDGEYSLITTASSLFGIEPAKDSSFLCSPKIIRISDLRSPNELQFRSQVLISGEIHGNERVGPLASLVTAELLIWSANCIISHHVESCQKLDSFGGISLAQRYWLSFLATRRDTFIIPTANCLGYMQNKREDAGVDPNRDFPYSRNNKKCMLSRTAKLFMALMVSNVIQVVVTFHGGMVALGYEWGSKNHLAPKDSSPDDIANLDIATLMRKFAGSFKKEKAYPIGRINSLVYSVDGGMEDWLYASGWDPNPSMTKTCDASGSQLEQQLIKLTPENRALVFLAETSDHKQPDRESLGGSYEILDPRSNMSGHIPRNVRLSLAAIDLVQPYVCISASSSHFESHSLSNGRKQRTVLRANSERREAFHRRLRSENLRQRHSKGRRLNRTLNMAKSIQLEWYVGGSTVVDSTFLAWHRIPPHFSTSRRLLDKLDDHAYREMLLTKEVEAEFDRVNKAASNAVGEISEKLAVLHNIWRKGEKDSAGFSKMDYLPVIALCN